MVHEATISTDAYDVVVLGAGPAGASLHSVLRSSARALRW